MQHACLCHPFLAHCRGRRCRHKCHCSWSIAGLLCRIFAWLGQINACRDATRCMVGSMGTEVACDDGRTLNKSGRNTSVCFVIMCALSLGCLHISCFVVFV